MTARQKSHRLVAWRDAHGLEIFRARKIRNGQGQLASVRHRLASDVNRIRTVIQRERQRVDERGRAHGGIAFTRS